MKFNKKLLIFMKTFWIRLIGKRKDWLMLMQFKKSIELKRLKVIAHSALSRYIKKLKMGLAHITLNT